MPVPVEQLEMIPGERRVYTFDFSQMPELAVAGETLAAAVSVTAEPDGLIVGIPTLNQPANGVEVEVTGGVSPVTYTLKATTQTSGGHLLCGYGLLLALAH
jgi:hypothetical protein